MSRSSPRKNPVLHHNIVDRRKIVTKPFFLCRALSWRPSNHNDVSISIGWIAHYAPLLFEPLQLVLAAADLPLNVNVKADPTIVVRLVLPFLRTGIDRRQVQRGPVPEFVHVVIICRSVKA